MGLFFRDLSREVEFCCYFYSNLRPLVYKVTFFSGPDQYYRRLFCGFNVPRAPEGSTGWRFLEKPGGGF